MKELGATLRPELPKYTCVEVTKKTVIYEYDPITSMRKPILKTRAVPGYITSVGRNGRYQIILVDDVVKSMYQRKMGYYPNEFTVIKCTPSLKRHIARQKRLSKKESSTTSSS